MHCIASHCIASSWIASHCIASHCIASHCIASHRIASHRIVLHCISLYCIAHNCIALHIIALHYIELHIISLQVKVDAKVQVPEVLDLAPFRGKGLQPGEVLIPDTDGTFSPLLYCLFCSIHCVTRQLYVSQSLIWSVTQSVSFLLYLSILVQQPLYRFRYLIYLFSLLFTPCSFILCHLMSGSTGDPSATASNSQVQRHTIVTHVLSFSVPSIFQYLIRTIHSCTLVLSCPVLSCPVLSCPVLSCPVLSCPVLS